MGIHDVNQPAVEVMQKLIEDKGVKQCTIAEKAGITEQAFSDMLNGRRVIKIADIVPLANALGVTPNDLFAFSASEPSGQKPASTKQAG